MKRRWILCMCGLVLLFALASCAPPAWPTASGETEAPAPSPATQAPATPAATESGYGIDTEYYDYADGRFDMKASYPKLEGAGLDDVNALIKTAALETINEWLASEDDGSQTTIETTGAVTYSDPGFISITFTEYYNNTMAVHPSSVFRTLNIDLEKKAAVPGGSLLAAGADLYRALHDAAGRQLSAAFADEITLETIETGYDANAIYFTPDRVGFSIWVSHVLGDHVELTLPYAEAEPFMTSSPIWDRFK